MTGNWAARREGGRIWLLRPALWLALHFGRRAGTLFLPAVTLWFLLMAGPARAASREYLTRVLGRPARLTDVARHFAHFAAATFDRVFLLSGRLDGWRIDIEGLPALDAALAQGRGCILLGAHLGSFEALRTLAAACPVPVRMLMYRRNDGALTRMLDALAPGLRQSVIEIGRPGAMLELREAIGRGEVVGILADRAPSGQKLADVPFLGSLAQFPTGPMQLAASLGPPVFLGWGLRMGPRHYCIRLEAFADPVVAPRAGREEALRGWVARYAARLEAGCRAAPFNWFNFYPFWEHPVGAGGRLAAGDDAGAGRDAGGAGVEQHATR